MRRALLLILCLHGLRAQAPASWVDQFSFQAGRVRVGEVLHYRKSNLDGSRPLLLSVFVPAHDLVDVLKVEHVGRHLARVSGRMDWSSFTLVEAESWNALERGSPRLQATFRSSPQKGTFEVSIGKAHASVPLPVTPTHLYNFDFTSLNLAWRHLRHPDRAVQVGVVDPDFEYMRTRFKPQGEHPGLMVYKGLATFTPEGEEKHGGVLCTRYRVGGPAFRNIPGTLWVDKNEGHWVEFRHALPDNPDWSSFRLELLHRESMTPAEWEAFIRSRAQRAADLIREFGDDD